MDSWENGDELPTKFNKYRRLKAKEAAQAQNKCDSPAGGTESSTVLTSSLVLSSNKETYDPPPPQLQPVYQNDTTLASSLPFSTKSLCHKSASSDNSGSWTTMSNEENMDCSPPPLQPQPFCHSLDGGNSGCLTWSQRPNGSPRDYLVDNATTMTAVVVSPRDERICRSPRTHKTDGSPYRVQYDRSPLGQRLPHSAGSRGTLTHDSQPLRSVDQLPLAYSSISVERQGLGSCPMLDLSSLAVSGANAVTRLPAAVMTTCHCGSCPQCRMNFHTSSSAGSLYRGSDIERRPVMDVGLPPLDAPLDLTRRVCMTDRQQQQQQAMRHSVVQRTVLTSEGSSSRVVDEHFERSLGAKYSQLLKYPSAPLSAPPTTPSLASSTVDAGVGTSLISVSGTVDEHFSKSLGNMWRQIEENNTASGSCSLAPRAVPQPPTPGSVDDHFAKALGGETWLRIKADQELAAARSTSVPPVPPSSNAAAVVQFYPT